MIYSTDRLTLIKVARDAYGVETKTTTTLIPCRIENDNGIGPDRTAGQSRKPGSLILVGPDFTGKPGDRVVFSSILGATPTADEWEIITVEPVGGFGRSHFEVTV